MTPAMIVGTVALVIASVFSAVAVVLLLRKPPPPADVAQIKVDRQAPMWAVILAGPAISLILIGVILILSFRLYPTEFPEVAQAIVAAVGGIGMVLAGLLGIIVFRLAAGDVKSIRATLPAGSSLEINAENGSDARQAN